MALGKHILKQTWNSSKLLDEMLLISLGQGAQGGSYFTGSLPTILDEWLLAKGSTRETGRRPNGNLMNF